MSIKECCGRLKKAKRSFFTTFKLYIIIITWSWIFLMATEWKLHIRQVIWPSNMLYFTVWANDLYRSRAASSTVVRCLGVNRCVMILRGSDRRLVFGRPINRCNVFMFILSYWNWSLLSQNVCQGSEKKSHKWRKCLNWNVSLSQLPTLSFFSPYHAPKGLPNLFSYSSNWITEVWSKAERKS